MRIQLLMGATLGALLATGVVQAQQNYPVKPVRMIVPFPAGGQTDVVARAVAQKLSENFGQPVVVDNRPGAGGTIGANIAVQATPDGYSVAMVSASFTANAAIYKLPFDPVKDVAPIVYVGEIPNLVSVHPSGPARSIKELIAYARANPGKVNYASGGIGSGNHLAAELFAQMTGVQLTHVPYKGATSGVTDLMSGQIQLVFAGLTSMVPHVKANRVRGLAVSSIKRSSSLPDVPTVAETVPGYEAVSWSAILGPKGLPAHAVARWNKEVNAILQQADFRERMTGVGLEPVGGPPERFRQLLVTDIAKWQKVVATAGIKPGN
jgi:tripartite-type tricarboxylate transporter receptor subunit TctC